MKLVLPFLLSSLLLSALAAAAASDAVLDTDGNALKRGTEYYILLSPGKQSGLTLASRNGECPLDVAKARSEDDNVLPIRFYPADEGEDTVRLSKDANFQFLAYTTCMMSTMWQIRFHEAANRYYVSTGGVPGNPGKDTLSNWFTIREAEDGSNSYKLTYCPTVCNFCRPYCGDLGLFVEDGRKWLGIRGPPLSVVFKKAPEETVSV
ncbi:hypothetical protein Taro_004530 [Colocasia esculenta]|uniref:Miraculin n=1 Tax=Colocasia esculenta TaxID=4460 RepID=A0A843TRW2_COLES|nr:hypothetical protein [Colocasia esculenta]